MLRTVFIGSQNDFNQIIVHWLAQRTNVVGVVWTKATAWQNTWVGRWNFARRRWKRYSLLKVVDETLLFLYYHTRLARRDQADLRRHIYEPYWSEHGIPQWEGDAIFTHNVNEAEVLDFLRARRPDAAFAMCINNYFGDAVRAISRHGVFLWHEGFTPEYKGLYSPFWAVHNLDFDRIGYTLLRMNDKLDAGEIFVQGQAREVDPREHYHGFIGHKAIFDSLPEIEVFLKELEAGTAVALERSEAQPCYYTYPGITDFIRKHIRLRRWSRNIDRSWSGAGAKETRGA